MPFLRETGVVGSTKYEERVGIVDLQSGQFRLISPADLYVYEFDWSPDSRQLVLTAAPAPGDANRWIARPYTLDVQNEKITEIYKPPFQIAFPSWSPDGKTIAFVGGLMSDEVSFGGDIFLFRPEGGASRNLTADEPRRLRASTGSIPIRFFLRS